MAALETIECATLGGWGDWLCWAEAGGRVDAYLELGVGRDATAHEIKGAYRRGLRRFHPDCGQVPALLAEARSRQLNAAYARVRDDLARRAYDASLG